MSVVSKLKKTVAPAAEAKPAAKRVIPRRAPGTAPARKPLPKFKAPADFKPAFYEIYLGIGRDGMIDPRSFKMIRIQGKIDNPEAKRSDVSEFDSTTMLGVIARLSSIMFITNLEKRLQCFPAGSKYRLTIRVSKRAADGTLGCTVRLVHRMNAEGKWRLVKDKTDITYRRLRRSARVLPSAFVAAQLPPKGVRRKKEQEEEVVVARKLGAANDEEAPRKIRRVA